MNDYIEQKKTLTDLSMDDYDAGIRDRSYVVYDGLKVFDRIALKRVTDLLTLQVPVLSIGKYPYAQGVAGEVTAGSALLDWSYTVKQGVQSNVEVTGPKIFSIWPDLSSEPAMKFDVKPQCGKEASFQLWNCYDSSAGEYHPMAFYGNSGMLLDYDETTNSVVARCSTSQAYREPFIHPVSGLELTRARWHDPDFTDFVFKLEVVSGSCDLSQALFLN